MEFLFLLVILLFSVVIHEVAHGTVANSLGDSTAKNAGRLTLNPIKHLDPMGSFIVPLLLRLAGSPLIFGWAKPVPVNPYNFRDQKYGQLKVSIAGPGSNFIMAFIFGLAARALPLELVAKRQIFTSLFTSGTAFWEQGFLPQVFFLFTFIVFINILLAVFNLLPIPPLDGSHVLFTFLPRLEYKVKIFISKVGLLFIPLVFMLILFIFPVMVQFIIMLTGLFLGL